MDNIKKKIDYMEHVVEDCQANVNNAMKEIREYVKIGRIVDRTTGRWIRELTNDLDRAYAELMVAEGKLEALRYAEKEVEE